jgi:hypothetical protein
MKFTAIALLIFSSCNAGALQGSLFRPRVVIPLPNKPSNLALADLNKDGRLDLIVASEEARTVQVMFGQTGDVPFRVATDTRPACKQLDCPKASKAPANLLSVM